MASWTKRTEDAVSILPRLSPHSGEPSPTYTAPIREWTVSERPREKLTTRGPAQLTDAELIGIVLGSGTRTKDGPISAVQLGHALLRTYGSLRSLSRRDLKEIMRVLGVGKAKGAQLMAAFEIGKRVASEPLEDRVQVRCPEDAAQVYAPMLRDLKREVFKVVLLTTSNHIIGDFNASEGGLAASIVEPRAVFQKAILENAASVICLHNHPSGNLEPSREDIRITRQLVECGRLMGIPVHDHIIIAGDGFTSLSERGLMG